MDDQRADYDRLLTVSNKCDTIQQLISLSVSKPEKLDTYAQAMVILADDVLKTLHQLQTDPND